MTRVRFDECLSHRVVAALKAFGLPAGIEIEHPSDCGEGGAQDVDWLPAFKASGGRCIVTGDPKMRGRINERLALQEAGFVAIFPPRRDRWFDRLKRHGQAAYFFRWMPVIAQLAAEAEAGDHFMLPPNFDADPNAVVGLRRLSGPTLAEVRAKRPLKEKSRSAKRPPKGAQQIPGLSRRRARG